MLARHRAAGRGCGRVTARCMAALVSCLLVLVAAQANAHEGGGHHQHHGRRLASSPTWSAGGRARCGTQTTAVQAQSANKVVAQSLKSGTTPLVKGSIKVQVRCVCGGADARVCSELVSCLKITRLSSQSY